MAFSSSDLETLKQLIREGKSINYLAKVFQTSESNIKILCFRNGIKISELRAQNLSGAPSTLQKINVNVEDLATRIRVLKGEQLRKEKPSHFFSDEQIKDWLNGVEGVDKFCQEVLNIELQPYQLDMVDKMLNSRRCVFILGRQSGKDFTISCFVVWLCITKSNQRVLLVSPAQRQSDLLFERILNFIGGNNELFDSVEKSNLEVLKFRNHSDVYNLPATSFIRGFTAVTHIFVNESAHGITDEMINSVLTPMLATTNGNLVLMSSPAGCMGATWDAFNNPIYAKLQLPSSSNKHIPKEWFDYAKSTMSAIAYDCEINANFTNLIDNFFGIDLINKISYEYDFHNFPNPDKEYFLGIDWGRLRDSSVLCVISKNRDKILRIENIYEYNNKPFTEQVESIKMLHATFRFRRIVAEYSGLGIAPSERLKEAGLPASFFKPQIKSKEEVFIHLLKTMENGNIIIPKNHIKLQYELRTFRYEVSERGTKLHHISGGSDDIVDALCYGIWATHSHNPLITNLSLRPPVKASNEPIVLFKETNLQARKVVEHQMTWGEKLKYMKHTGSIRY